MRQPLVHKSLALLSKALVHIRGELSMAPLCTSPRDTACRVAIFAPNWFAQHFRTDGLWRRAYATSLWRKGIRFEILSNPDGARPGQKVIWRPSESLIPHAERFTLHMSEHWVEMARLIERGGGVLTPSSRVISMYENKVNMHRMFDGLGIKSPRTFVVREPAEYEHAWRALGIPFIVKGPYSHSSMHICLVSSIEQADLLGVQLFSRVSAGMGLKPRSLIPLPVLLQEFLDIRRDLRVVFAAKDILLSYWRINTTESWKPTATRFGSKVLFGPVPDRWRGTIVETMDRIDFPWGAFDVAWDHDDLEVEPHFLEVSPCFDPNPPPPPLYAEDYFTFKYRWRLKHNWNDHYWKVVQEIADAQVTHLLAAKA